MSVCIPVGVINIAVERLLVERERDRQRDRETDRDRARHTHNTQHTDTQTHRHTDTQTQTERTFGIPDGVVDNADERLLVDDQAHAHACVLDPVQEVSGAIH